MEFAKRETQEAFVLVAMPNPKFCLSG
jgi:hypothetical protein